MRQRSKATDDLLWTRMSWHIRRAQRPRWSSESTNNYGHDCQDHGCRRSSSTGAMRSGVPTAFPVVLKRHDYGEVVRFDFTVPATAGINATLHSYEVKVAYESADAPTIVTSAVDEDTGNGAVNQVVTLSRRLRPVVPDSVRGLCERWPLDVGLSAQ